MAPTPPAVSTCHRAVLPRFKRNPSVDRGSGSRLRLDLEFAVHDLKSFAHADQTETLARQGVMFFKTATAVRNGQLEGVWRAAQIHLKGPNSAVLDGVL